MLARLQEVQQRATALLMEGHTEVPPALTAERSGVSKPYVSQWSCVWSCVSVGSWGGRRRRRLLLVLFLLMMMMMCV
jgi:hypothetical protein